MSEKLKQLLFGPLFRFGISQKLQATALWSMLESFSSPLFALILIPIFTHNLGLENYGLYVMVMAFVNFFGFTGLGMNTSITYYLALNYETSNPKNIAERLGSALALTFIGTASFACIFLLMLKVFTPLFVSHYPQLIAQQYLIYAALILITITQLDMVVSASLKGLQQFKTSSKVEFVLRFFSFIVIAVVAITQKNVFAIVSITLMMALISLIVRFRALSKIVHLHSYDIKINKHSANELFHFGKWMTLQNISGAIFNSLDKLALGYFFNTTVLGIYNIIVSITQLSHYVLASASSFILPKISRSANNIKSAQQHYIKSLAVSALIALIVMLILAILYPYVASHFSLGNVKYEYFLMLVSYGLLAISVPPYYFMLGLGKVKLLSIINMLSASAGVVAIMLLVHSYEIWGAALARVSYTITVMLTLLVLPFLFKRANEK